MTSSISFSGYRESTSSIAPGPKTDTANFSVYDLLKIIDYEKRISRLEAQSNHDHEYGQRISKIETKIEHLEEKTSNINRTFDKYVSKKDSEYQFKWAIGIPLVCALIGLLGPFLINKFMLDTPENKSVPRVQQDLRL